ncbi:MAG: tetratricopeptide repeat protein, partial [candidate division NC10 bacterium]
MPDATPLPHETPSQTPPPVQALESALEERRVAGDAAALAETCMKLAQAYAAQGSFRRALTTYEEAMKACEEREDRTNRLLCLKSMAGLCYREGAWNRALDLYHQALGLLRDPEERR